MIINTKQCLKDLGGREIKNPDGSIFALGEALGNIIASSKEGGKMKLFVLGSKLYQEAKVDVDEADLALIKNAVANTEAYGALIAGQCEKILSEIKPAKSKE